MSAGAEDRLLGFNEQLDIDGESLTLLDGQKSLFSVCGLVNRGLDALMVKKGNINFSEKNKSHIQFKICDATKEVKVGYHMKDSKSFVHRIKVLRRDDIVYMLDCEQHEEP